MCLRPIFLTLKTYPDFVTILGRSKTPPNEGIVGALHGVIKALEGFCSFEKITYTLIYEPRHEISNNVVCATSKSSDQPAHMRSLIRAFAGCLIILWVFSYWLNILKGGCTGSLEMPHCWESHVGAHMYLWTRYRNDK